ncbi:cobalamin B12-binding domain-containing protein [Methylomonas sp. BW4-1]|uniref:cobalamin B12-binding domain-containing protein n=1 Tax=Methylomonas sp. BW4-1 TaxID=3376685 RepID=UPI004043816C
MLDAYIQSYNQAVFETDKPAALEVVNHALNDGFSPEDIVFKLVIPAIELMMTLIEKDPDANLAQHFMTAQIAADVTEKMLEKFSKPPEMIGRVVIGAAYGDLHSLGKRIVSGCLKSLMVDVVDLGTNVTAEKFVDTAIAENAQVIAVSAMMVHTATSEKGSLGVRRLLQERGLEQQIKLAVGGAPYRFDPELYTKVGADAWAPDGVTAAKVIVDLIREVKP